ncbi:hypothetical protein N566_17310 [Streptomycetaceae bacterium MP113-05]|nr:hypothetical protein N566_17310 [Streptomycetaceae bacterium MP113-05]
MTAATAVRVCRLCGELARLEPHEHPADDPWACDGCLPHIVRDDATHVPQWAVRQSRPLRAVS